MKRILTACFLLCFFSGAWASTSADSQTQHHKKHHRHYKGDYKGAYVNAEPAGRFYLGAGAGAIFPNVNRNNYIIPGAEWPADHFISNKIGNKPEFFLATGYTWSNPQDWLPYYSLGVRYSYVSSMSVKGYIQQYSLQEFTNYNYNYQIQQQNLFLMFKVDLYRWMGLMPYVAVGAGPSFNRVSGYTETPLSNVTPRVSPGFGTKLNTNFAYTLGAGFDWAMTDNLWATVGYEYGDYGIVRTGNGVNTASVTGSSFAGTSLKNRLTASNVFLGLTYYFV